MASIISLRHNRVMLRLNSATLLIALTTLLIFGCLPDFSKETAKSTDSSLPKELTLDQKRVNGEFIREVHKVVLEREVTSAEEFLKYMNILDQGAHYEAIYNGIVYSSEYKKKENGVAPARALKTYIELATDLAVERLNDVNDEAKKVLQKKFEYEGLNKSLYFLKRRLGEELLKTFEEKKEYREKLSTWYGIFAKKLNSKNIDFGISARNNPDEYYHYKWALYADEDRIIWECLNRIHRIMNAQK